MTNEYFNLRQHFCNITLDHQVVVQFAVAALSSAPKLHVINGGGGDTAATATKLNHCRTPAFTGVKTNSSIPANIALIAANKEPTFTIIPKDGEIQDSRHSHAGGNSSQEPPGIVALPDF